jgi:hypothetical protein
MDMEARKGLIPAILRHASTVLAFAVVIIAITANLLSENQSIVLIISVVGTILIAGVTVIMGFFKGSAYSRSPED